MEPIIDRTTDTRARQISITPAAYDGLRSLASGFGMTPRAVASVILCHYCSKKAFMETMDRRFLDPVDPIVICDSTTDKRARQVRITPAAYERLHSLASGLGMTLRAVASGILCHYCSKKALEKALV